MAAKAKQILITTEKHEVLILRKVGVETGVVCPHCGQELASSSSFVAQNYDGPTATGSEKLLRMLAERND